MLALLQMLTTTSLLLVGVCWGFQAQAKLFWKLKKMHTR